MPTYISPSQDFLAGRPALPTTRIPGYHHIPIHSTRIRIRRYQAPHASSTSSETLLARVRDDPLEKGWKEVNGTGDNVLEGGCAISITEGEGLESQRVLWVFHDDGYHEPDLSHPDIKELDGPHQLLDISRLVTCSSHGQRLSCLARNKGAVTPCNLTWTTDEATTKHWDLFRDALVEKMSWRAGQRIFLRPGSLALPPSEVKAKLYPLSNSTLLLTIAANSLPRCLSSPPSLPRHLRPLLLRPLNIPALMLGPYTPTAAQEAHLNGLFEDTLGSTWNAGAAGRKIDAQLNQTAPIEWAVYWVPILPANLDLTKMTALDAAKEMQKGQGVISIWPHNLIHGLTPSSDHSPTSHHISPRRPLVPSLPTTSSLMDTAASVFDFLSSYQPQPSPQATPDAEEDGQMDEDQDFELTVTASSQASVRAPSPIDGGSDIDDLFSAHSPSPTLDPVPLSRLPSPASDIPYLDPDNTITLDHDIVMSSPTPPRRGDDEHDITLLAGRNQSNIHAAEGEATFVTEDDFDFFDSPITPKVDDDGEQAGLESEETGPLSTDQAHVNDTPQVEAVPESIDVPDIPQTTGEEAQEDNEQSPFTYPPLPGSSPVEPLVQPKMKKSVSFDPSAVGPVPPQPVDQGTALVPSPFAPIEIDYTTLPTFAYSLPSPAPTPESLRPELIERLQSLTQKQTPDYASVWEIESEPSDIEEDEEYTGAPPTPVSVSDLDNETSVVPTPNKVEGGAEMSEVLWENIMCAGCEWTVLRHELNAAKELGKGWSTSWNDGSEKVSVAPLTPPAEPKVEKKRVLETAVCDRLVEAIVCSRHLRDVILDGVESPDSDGVQNSLAVVKDGVRLDGFVNSLDNAEDANLDLRAMDACRIHTGFGGNITQISVAALRYWRQLGLQPSGGRKDITAFLVCDVDGSLAATSFLERMSQTYEACQLGKHVVGEATAAKNGVIAVPPVGIVNSLTALLSTAPHDSVVYVVLPSSSPAGLSGLIEMILAPTVPTDAFRFVKILPSFALEARQAQPIAFEIYDTLPRPIRPIRLRGLPLDSPIDYVQYPAFTLAPATPPKPELTLAWPLRSYDVMGRWKWIHAAYALDTQLKLAVACVIDADGEMWATKTWHVEGIIGMVENIWTFIRTTVENVIVDYRLAICSLGLMSTDELDAWKGTISPKIPAVLLMAEVPFPGATSPSRAAVHTIPLAAFTDPSTRIIDESLEGRFGPVPCLPLDIPGGNGGEEGRTTIFPQASFFLNLATPSDDFVSSKYHVVLNRPPPQKEEENVVNLLGVNYHRLFTLGRMRFGMYASAGPAHLEGVRMGLEGIRRLSAAQEES